MFVIGADYPFLDVLWTLLIFFAWVVWIWVMITILTDLFRRKDVSGWGKAAWVVFLIVLPWIGALTYLIMQHDGMADRSTRQAEAAQGQFDQYVRKVADKSGPAGEIDTAKKLLDDGTISREEFDSLKAKALA
jgi:Phospholipase_D-nuclease N-terminal